MRESRRKNMPLLALSDLTADSIKCAAPVSRTDGRAALRHRIYNVSQAPDLRVVWRQSFRAYEGEEPRHAWSAAHLCRWLSPQQWPYCRALRPGAARTLPHAPRQNELLLVSMPCAFTDSGTNFRGALYDARRVLNAQHRGATPKFARGALRRYEIVAIGLTPYGHLSDAHFYASTAPWILQVMGDARTKRSAHVREVCRSFASARAAWPDAARSMPTRSAMRCARDAVCPLQLLHLLPSEVPILVALSPKLRQLYSHLNVPAERLHTLPSGGAAYATRMLSLVTLPFGALEPLGAAALSRVRTRLVPTPWPPPEQRDRVVFLSRQDQAPRRSLRNQRQALQQLGAAIAAVPQTRRTHRGWWRASASASAESLATSSASLASLARSAQAPVWDPMTTRVAGAPPPRFDLEVFEGSRHLSFAETRALFTRAALVVGPHGGAFLNLVYCAPGTPVVEIGYKTAQPMAYPSYYHTMARRLELAFYVVLGEGAYDRPIRAPIDELVPLVASLLAQSPERGS